MVKTLPLSETEAKVLMALHDERKCYVTELQQKAKISRTAIYNAIRKLEKLNLIVVREQLETFPFQKYIEITDKGEKIAELLIQVEDILNER